MLSPRLHLAEPDLTIHEKEAALRHTGSGQHPRAADQASACR